MRIHDYNTPIREHHMKVLLVLHPYQTKFDSAFTPHSSQHDTYLPFKQSPAHHIYFFSSLGKFGLGFFCAFGFLVCVFPQSSQEMVL